MRKDEKEVTSFHALHDIFQTPEYGESVIQCQNVITCKPDIHTVSTSNGTMYRR